MLITSELQPIMCRFARVPGEPAHGQTTYAYRGGSLFQPVCLGQRDDIEMTACTLGQLKYKAAGEDDEADGATGEYLP